MKQIQPWMLTALSRSTALKIMEPSYHPPLFALRAEEIARNAREQAIRGEMDIERAFRRRRG